MSLRHSLLVEMELQSRGFRFSTACTATTVRALSLSQVAVVVEQLHTRQQTASVWPASRPWRLHTDTNLFHRRKGRKEVVLTQPVVGVLVDVGVAGKHVVGARCTAVQERDHGLRVAVVPPLACHPHASLHTTHGMVVTHLM